MGGHGRSSHSKSGVTMEIGDAVRAKECPERFCFCPFCQLKISKTGLILDSWIDLDDNPSVIAAFEGEEIILREFSNIHWLRFSSYEVIN